MAITKIIGAIHPAGKSRPYKSLGNAIRYALNAEKTGGKLYTSSNHCSQEHALVEMIKTTEYYNKQPKRPTDRVGYHFMISWKPEEKVTPEQALEIGQAFCAEYLGDYESVCGVHNDKEHLHVHIVFNSVSCRDGYKYRYETDDWEKEIQPLTDRLCAERGLATLEEDTGLSLAEYRRLRMGKGKKQGQEKKGYSNYENAKKEPYTQADDIRYDLDYFIYQSSSVEELEKKLQDAGYQIRHGKSKRFGTYTALWREGMKRFCRTYTLGEDYTDAAIRRRIQAMQKPLPELPQDPGLRYAFPRKYFCLRIRYQTTNPYIRGIYAKIYRMGVMPCQSRRPNYRSIRKMIKKIHCLETQLAYLEDPEIRSAASVDQRLQSVREKLGDLKEEQKEKRQELAPYLHMLRSCQEGSLLAEHLPFSMEELEQVELAKKEMERRYKEEYQNLRLQEEALKELKSSMQQGEKEQELDQRQLEEIDAAYGKHSGKMTRH